MKGEALRNLHNTSSPHNYSANMNKFKERLIGWGYDESPVIKCINEVKFENRQKLLQLRKQRHHMKFCCAL